MTPRELVEHARSFYIERFDAFVATQRQAFENGVAERLVEGPAYQGLIRQDFATGDKTFVVFVPDKGWSMDPAYIPLQSATCMADRLDWQEIVILHDLDVVTPEYIEEWFTVWFDPHELRHEIREPGVVHLLSLQEGRVDIDMGTAPAEAFWQMIGLLEKAGAKNIYVNNSKGCARFLAGKDD
jgi:hypothetical protein